VLFGVAQLREAFPCEGTGFMRSDPRRGSRYRPGYHRKSSSKPVYRTGLPVISEPRWNRDSDLEEGFPDAGKERARLSSGFLFGLKGLRIPKLHNTNQAFRLAIKGKRASKFSGFRRQSRRKLPMSGRRFRIPPGSPRRPTKPGQRNRRRWVPRIVRCP
jgi:hypothetical protein